MPIQLVAEAFRIVFLQAFRYKKQTRYLCVSSLQILWTPTEACPSFAVTLTMDLDALIDVFLNGTKSYP